MKKILFGILCSIVPLLIIATLVVIPIGNNKILKEYTEQLKNFRLNAPYDIIAIDDKCGKLVGNGNGMQYFSAMLINSNERLLLEDNELEGVFLIKVDDNSFNNFIDEYGFGYYCENIKNKLTDIKDTQNYYVLYSFYNAPLESIWNNDLRAH